MGKYQTDTGCFVVCTPRDPNTCCYHIDKVGGVEKNELASHNFKSFNLFNHDVNNLLENFLCLSLRLEVEATML